jgi:hypothetical protein
MCAPQGFTVESDQQLNRGQEVQPRSVELSQGARIRLWVQRQVKRAGDSIAGELTYAIQMTEFAYCRVCQCLVELEPDLVMGQRRSVLHGSPLCDGSARPMTLPCTARELRWLKSEGLAA